MAVSISERLQNNDLEFYNMLIDKIFSTLRVSAPGIIQAFDPTTQTATVKVAIREHVRQENMEYVWTEIPLLLDVPVVFPCGGGYVLTFPVSQGDECLVVFSDMCIDAWFSLGGVQNQIEKRRHDLSDAICIPGLWSQPNKLPNFPTDGAQLRTIDGLSCASVKSDGVDLQSGASRIRVSNNNVNISAQTVTINGVDFSSHTHMAPSGGGRTSEPS